MAQVQERIDVYSLVTNNIIKQLEGNSVPWRKPWKDNSIPQNLLTRKPYRGINLLLLGSLQYEQNLFLTFHQVKQVGGSVRKGEKGHLIVFWKPIIMAQKSEGEAATAVSFVLRYYTVFNIAQCEHVPEQLTMERAAVPFSPISCCEQIIEEMQDCPSIVYERQQAFYNPLLDYINMPKADTFMDEGRYYATLFHELVHSTGHRSRLARHGMTTMSFGDTVYSLEELTAEIGSCFLSSLCGIGAHGFEQSVAYIKGWLRALQNDKKLIVQASGQAQKAVDYILNVREAEESDLKTL